ncbi:unnamed protein product [Effrenium voratum]|uniref:Uncharacterized protein n=1 Tax=Effrenium voratum TaxID=2562239 RepID=A0AA36MIN0_9DINO|nr:unnamed protein product [Effrenium voratum]
MTPDAAEVLLAEGACCEATCGGFQCPSGWKARSAANEIVQPSPDICCYRTCELHVCDAGSDLTLRGDAALVAGTTDDDCCVSTCSTYSCSQKGYILRLDAGEITGGVGGNSDAACCAKSCALFRCAGRFKQVDNPAEVVGDTAEVCCTAGVDS